jgi:hypothetical protein
VQGVLVKRKHLQVLGVRSTKECHLGH